MRLDFALYILAITMFVIATYTTVMTRELYVYMIFALGIIFLGLGYMARLRRLNGTLSPSQDMKSNETVSTERQKYTMSETERFATYDLSGPQALRMEFRYRSFPEEAGAMKQRGILDHRNPDKLSESVQAYSVWKRISDFCSWSLVSCLSFLAIGIYLLIIGYMPIEIGGPAIALFCLLSFVFSAKLIKWRGEWHEVQE